MMLREGEGEGEGARACVCVCVCVCARENSSTAASHNASVKACGEKRASKRETIKL